MKLHSRGITPEVHTNHAAHRSVTLRLAGLYFAMTTTEALTLADALHDAAEQDNTND